MFENQLQALAAAFTVPAVVLLAIVEIRMASRYGYFYLARQPAGEQLPELFRIYWRELDAPQRSMYWGGLGLVVLASVLSF